MEKNRCALVVDDDKDLCNIIKEELESLRLFRQVLLSYDGADAKRKICNQKFDLIVLDIKMPKLDGISLIKTLVEDLDMNPDKIVLMSGSLITDNVLKAKKWNVRNIILKPFGQDLFLQKIKEVFKKDAPSKPQP